MTRRSWYRLTAGMTTALMLAATPALAGGGKHGGAAGSSREPSASPTTESSAGFMGRHRMEGEVTAIDKEKGTLSLKTAEGELDLHFPPSALASVEEGDRIAVELAMKPDTGSSASPRTDQKQ